jgi:hypothetical protein
MKNHIQVPISLPTMMILAAQNPENIDRLNIVTQSFWSFYTYRKKWREMKTEALYIPPPGTEASDTDKDKVFVENTDHGYITFNRRFTYLVSIITEDLEDGAEIHARLGKANGILHSLNNLWRSKGGMSVRMKKQFNIVTVITIVLWGCESLTIQAGDLKLEVFHHKAMQHILCISKWQQATTRLTNENLRKKLDYIATMEEIIDERRLYWLGNAARQSDEKLPKKFLTAWIMNPRKSGGQNQTLRDFNASSINCMLVYNGVATTPSKECPLTT